MVVGCRRDEPAAWDQLQRWYARLAQRTLAGFFNLTAYEREEASDNARTTFSLEIMSGRLRAETDGAIVCFARTIVRNAARDVWRRRRPGEELSTEVPDDAPSPSAAVSARAQLECVERLVLGWKDEDRLLLMLKLEQVSSAAIQADLVRLFGVHVSVSAVDVRYHRLRRELREHCGEKA
jgi:DNA-directed RNA polymerase specialized sigma24 family protein